MNASFWAGVAISAIGWAILLSGPSLGHDVINIHLLTISQMIIIGGHAISLMAAIFLAATKIADALVRLPNIGDGHPRDMSTTEKVAEREAAHEVEKRATQLAAQRKFFVSTFGEPIIDDTAIEKGKLS